MTIAKSTDIIKTIQKEITDGKIAIDGLAGRETKDATAQWQRENGLTPDGIAGSLTRGKIFGQVAPEIAGWWRSIQYFSRKEFACKCGRYCDGYPAQMQRGVVELADRARAELKGVGFVRIEGKSAQQALAWAQKQPEVRYAYAIDTNFVHMDIE